MRWAAGSAWSPCCCSARGTAATQGRPHRRAHPPSTIPFLALGAWVLSVGWFGFNVMSAQTLDKISGLVAVNSLMAMAGGTLAALVVGRNDPGFVHNGPLAGLVAICAGSDVMHPIGALATGAVAGALFVVMFTVDAEPLEDRRRARRVAAARPVRRVGRHRGRHLRRPRRWAASAASRSAAQVAGTLLGVAIAVVGRARSSTARCRRRWACGSTRKRNSTAPTSRSTRSARRRSANPAGRSATAAKGAAGLLPGGLQPRVR